MDKADIQADYNFRMKKNIATFVGIVIGLIGLILYFTVFNKKKSKKDEDK